MKNLFSFFIKRTQTINAVALLVAVSLLGDHLVSRIHQKHAVKAICDNSTHFLIGGISWLIVCINTSFLQSHTRCLYEIVLCAFIAAVIDVDHFISARSLSLKEATNLRERPFLHSSTVPVVTCACLLAWKSAVLKRLAAVIFVAFSSHHIRDATRRGLLFHPFGSTPPIPYKLYVSLNCLIPLLISLLLDNKKVQYTAFVA